MPSDAKTLQAWAPRYLWRASLRFFVAMIVVFGVAILMLIWNSQDGMEAAEEHLRLNQPSLRDAVAEVTGRYIKGEQIDLGQLPAPLAIDSLRFAIVGTDHVTLAVSRNPDTTYGFRVWDDEQDSLHQDSPTRIPGVYRFSYCNDYEESPTNQID